MSAKTASFCPEDLLVVETSELTVIDACLSLSQPSKPAPVRRSEGVSDVEDIDMSDNSIDATLIETFETDELNEEDSIASFTEKLFSWQPPASKATCVEKLMAYVHHCHERKVVIDERHLRELLAHAGWECKVLPLAADKWWRHELIYTAPWFDSCEANETEPVAGLDFFFELEDIHRYLCLHSNLRASKPIVLSKDLRSESYSLDLRIHEIAQSADHSQYNLELMLNDSGWRKQTLRAGRGLNREVYVPPWGVDNFDESMLLSMTAGEDFFENWNDVIGYLKDYGNVRRECDVSTSSIIPVSCRRRSSPRVTAAGVDSPGGRLQHIIVNASKLNRPDVDMWKLLKSIGWRHESVSDRLFNHTSIYIPPWALELFLSQGKKDPFSMELRRDYFTNTQDILHYVSKYGNQRSDAPATPEEEPGRFRGRKSVSVKPLIADGSDLVGEKMAAIEIQKELAEEVSAAAPKLKKAVKQKRVRIEGLDSQIQPLAKELLQLHKDGVNVSRERVLRAAALERNYHWICCSFGNVWTSCDSIEKELHLKGRKEGEDYFVSDKAFYKYVDAQLLKLGFDRKNNTQSERFLIQDFISSEAKSSPSSGSDASQIYSLLPPKDGVRTSHLAPRPQDTFDRYATTDSSPLADQKPETLSSAPTEPFSSEDVSAESAIIVSSSRKRSLVSQGVTSVPSSEKKRKIKTPKVPVSVIKNEASTGTVAVESRTLQERVNKALSQFELGAVSPKLIGREDQLRKIIDSISSVMEAKGRRVDSSDGVEKRKGLYLCGVCGVGKTLTVEHAINILMTYEEVIDGRCQVTRFSGPGIGTSFFSSVAEKLNWRGDACNWNEKQAEEVCMKKFLNSKKLPFHVLLIDEIDMVSPASIKKLYEVCASEKSNVFVVGIANDISFAYNLNIPDNKTPDIVLFKRLEGADLDAILFSRAEGLFEKEAIQYCRKLCMGPEGGGDVRFLLDLAANVVRFTAGKECNKNRMGMGL